VATTLTIPLLTLPVGSRTFGPHTAADAETKITLSIDRTVTGGLNSLTAASAIEVDVQQSADGGATWQDLGAWTSVGGIYIDRHGITGAVSLGIWPLFPGTSRKLQATVTVAGTPIAVAGSLVTQ
jgi:hypothetical protein